MKAKILAAVWFIVALVLVCAEPQTNHAMLYYSVILINFGAACWNARKKYAEKV